MAAPSTTHGRAYQGYPYSNPIVLDAPSLDAETAARWTNLPRNPIVPVQRPRNNPETNNSDAEASKNTQASKPDTNIEPDPRVYIDFPTNEFGEYVADDRREDNRTEDDRREDSRSDDASTNFVEDTIFYDPFEDRRINVGQSPQAPSPGNGAEGPSHGVSSPSTQTGSSSLDDTRPPPTRLPFYITKEANIYGPTQPTEDRFPTSTSVQEFPEPPPAYTEIERPVDPPPPRTEVIVPDTANISVVANPDRKLVFCPFCGIRVYTLAIKENGAFTHILAGFFIIAFAPLTLVVYCTDYFKYRNHYCPNCNRLIGYEVPILCQDMVYIKAD